MAGVRAAIVGVSAGRRAPSVSAATWIELVAVAAAIAFLWPLFAQVAAIGAGRDARYAEAPFEVGALPAPLLPRLCDALGGAAEPSVRDRLCGSWGGGARALGPAVAWPLLRTAIADASRAFQAPLRTAASRLEALRAEAREGRADARETGDAAAALEAEIQPYLERFRLEPSDAPLPAPLRCAAGWVESSVLERQSVGDATTTGARGRPTRVGTTGSRSAPLEVERPEAVVARANALLLLGAALDGEASTRAVAAQALLPPAPVARVAGCAEDPVASLAAAADLMLDAREGEASARKNAAMLALLQDAGVQWAAAMGLGYFFVLWSRAAPRTTWAGAGSAQIAWAALAWLGRVPWPFAGHHGFTLGRLDPELPGRPAAYVIAMAAVGVALLLGAVMRRAGAAADGAASATPALAPSSRLGYAGLVLATGLGLLLLLDLSARGAIGNRYLALYHQGHLWLGMTLFSVLLFLRRPLGRGLAWILAVAGEAGARLARRLGAPLAGLVLVAGTLVAVAAFGLVLANKRQLTSELGRLWLVIGAAWYFFLRGGPLAERLAEARGSLVSLVRYTWPMLFIAGVLVAAMVATRDMGPLLIAGYASGAFVAAAVAAWWHLRSRRSASALLLAVLLFAAWIVAVTSALFMLGTVDAVTAARLESLAAPLASGNDQLALVSWFQRSAPADGYGLGAAPWCGYAGGARCSGVPAQIHSDYTFTALVGVFGMAGAWAAAIGCALWLHRLVRHHGRVTRGEPRLVATAAGVGHDGQALLSWIAVAWVVLTSCQLAVTVAGNLAVLPLTGVTFPFVSFGMTSLVINLAFLALCLQVDVAAEPAHG